MGRYRYLCGCQDHSFLGPDDRRAENCASHPERAWGERPQMDPGATGDVV